MANLVLASLFLPLSHFLIASTSLRDVLVRRLGERPYSGGYGPPDTGRRFGERLFDGLVDHPL
jgi:hypothetical protein